MYFVQLRIAPQNPKTPQTVYNNNMKEGETTERET